MKVRVFTEEKFTVRELKRVKDIMKAQKQPNDVFNREFSDRYRGLAKVSKNQTNVYFDSMNAKAHTYEVMV